MASGSGWNLWVWLVGVVVIVIHTFNLYKILESGWNVWVGI